MLSFKKLVLSFLMLSCLIVTGFLHVIYKSLVDLFNSMRRRSVSSILGWKSFQYEMSEVPQYTDAPRK